MSPDDLGVAGRDSGPGGSSVAYRGRGPAGQETAERPSWPSSQPIVVGRGVPVFEPKAVSAKYRTVPYRPDTVMDGWSDGSFTIRAASLRGYDHRYDGSPRQDDMSVVTLPDQHRLVVAVADGVSAAPQSHVGAATAVRYASQWLATSLGEDLGSTNWKGLVDSTAWAVAQAAASLDGLPEPDPERAEALMATTLVCAVLERAGAGAVAYLLGVGDSGAWVFSGGSFVKGEGGKAQGGVISSSGTQALPRVPAEVDAVRVELGPDDLLLLGTDGFGDPLGSGSGDVGRLFAQVLRWPPPTLLEFAHILDFSRETFDDDRTLVAVWPRAAER